MARTLVGRLQLIVQAMGLGEAKKVQNALRGIENEAKRLSSGGWGAGFQRQLDKMGLAAKELDQVRTSWQRLQRAMASGNLLPAQRKAEISTWKTATLSQFAQVRASMRDTEREAKRMGDAIRRALKPVMIMGGGATGTYLTGTWGREALTAASEGRRVQAEAKYAGLSEDERTRIDTRANDLSGRYRISKSSIFEVMKEASLAMPSTDAALAVSDEMARAYVVLSNMFGPEGAISGLRAFNKAMDNIEKITPEEYTFGLEHYMKAQQVVGRDLSPEAFAQAIKFSRTGGKVYSDEFLFDWLPIIIGETGGPDAGTQLRAAFDQLLVGRASKQARQEQEYYGLRGEDGRLVAQDEFTHNPIVWVNDHLLPALRAKGVDTEDETELARVIGELTTNRLASDLISRAIMSFEQYRRLVEERLPNAQGLDAADNVQADNPFAAWAGFKDALGNVSDAVLPMETIGAGLNSFADQLNAFAQKIRDSDPTTLSAMGVAGGVAAAWGTWKVMAGIGALVTAGPSLQTAAVMLQSAAIAQGGGGGTVGKIAKGGGILGAILTAARLAASPGGLAAGAGVVTAKALIDTTPRDPSLIHPDRAVEAGNYHRQFHGIEFEGGMHRAGRGAGPQPGIYADVLREIEEVEAAGADAGASLSFNAKPTIDMGEVNALKAAVLTILDAVRQIGPAVATARANADAEARRAMTDYGVVP